MGKRTFIVAVILVGFLLAGLTAYRFKQKSADQASLKKSKGLAIPVTVIIPKKQYFSSKLVVSGTLAPEEEVQIAPKVTGRLLYLKVDEGNNVRKGDIIGELDHSEIDAQILQAQAQVRIAKANLTKAYNGPLQPQILQAQATVRQAEASLKQLELNRKNVLNDLENYKKLTEKGILTQQQLNNTQTQYEVINQQVNSAKQEVYSAQQALNLLKEGTRPEEIEANKGQVESANSLIELYKSQLANYKILSPINGVVTKKLLDSGSLVSPSTPIITISNNSNPDVVMSIPEKEIDSIKIGQKVDVETTNNPNKTYKAVIKEINPSIDLQTRVLKVKGKFIQKNDLKLGVLLNCSILTQEKHNTYVIPSDAIVNSNDQTVVYVASNDNKAVMKPVTLGIQDTDKTEVLTGISSNDKVVLKGSVFLSSGTKIEIQNDGKRTGKKKNNEK